MLLNKIKHIKGVQIIKDRHYNNGGIVTSPILNKAYYQKLLKLRKARLGDLPDRFIASNNGTDLVYDKLLKGHWSALSQTSMAFPDTYLYLQQNGFAKNTGIAKINSIKSKLKIGKQKQKYRLPSVYALSSLFTEELHSESYLAKEFLETRNHHCWSLTQVTACGYNYWAVNFSIADIQYGNVYSHAYVRFFKPDE